MKTKEKSNDDLICDVFWFTEAYKILSKFPDKNEWTSFMIIRKKALEDDIDLISLMNSLNYFIKKKVIISTMKDFYSVSNMDKGEIKLTDKGEQYFIKMEREIIEIGKIVQKF